MTSAQVEKRSGMKEVVDLWGQGGHPKVRLAVFVYNKGDRGRETCGDPHDVQSI